MNTPTEESYQLQVQAHDVQSPTLFALQPASIIIQVGSPEYLEGLMAMEAAQEDKDGVLVVILNGENEDEDGKLDHFFGDDDSDWRNGVGENEHIDNMVRNIGPSYSTHRITKRRVTRAVRPTVRKEFTETEGQLEGRIVFELTKEVEFETFKIRDENPWVTVEPRLDQDLVDQQGPSCLVI